MKSSKSKTEPCLGKENSNTFQQTFDSSRDASTSSEENNTRFLTASDKGFVNPNKYRICVSTSPKLDCCIGTGKEHSVSESQPNFLDTSAFSERANATNNFVENGAMVNSFTTSCDSKVSSVYSRPYIQHKQPELKMEQNISISVQPEIQLLNKLVVSSPFMPSNVKSVVIYSGPLSSVSVSKSGINSHSVNSQDHTQAKFSIVPVMAVKNPSSSTLLCFGKQPVPTTFISKSSGQYAQHLETPETVIKQTETLISEQKKEQNKNLQTKDSNSILSCSNGSQSAIKTGCQNDSTVKKNVFANEPVNADSPKSSPYSANLSSKSIKEKLKYFMENGEKPVHPFKNPVVLRHYLMPNLERIIIQDPESIPFRHPVDSVQIPDYYEIIKHPIDLSTIKTKLDTGQYQDGWEFIDDVSLMFRNARQYNRKSSRVYKFCVKLAQIFDESIDKSMRTLGHCCGQNYMFEPKILFCCIKNGCCIPKYAKYWTYEDRFFLCKKCYASEEDVIILHNTEETLTVAKTQLVEKKNDMVKKEPFVECIYCGRKSHRICVLHVEEIFHEGYICQHCLNSTGKIKRIPERFTSKNLLQTKVGSYLEERVNCFLEKESCDSRVFIRVVYQAAKKLEVKQGMKARYVDSGVWPAHFPYTAKTFLAFQLIEGVDVCFFAMFVQEYGSDCQPPNARRVYIAYLDSVRFFTPKNLRTSVYHEILLGYLDYVKCLGYTTAHLWSCPSNEGEDYIFHCHPEEQKNPNIKRLQDWYKIMLGKGVKEGIVRDYKDILTQALEDGISSASQLPYFEGDFWPMALETEISKLEGMAVKKISCRSLQAMHEEKYKGNEINTLNNEKATKSKKSKKSLKNSRNSITPYTGDALTDKMYSSLTKFKEVFIVIHLCTTQSAECVITEPDPPITSDIMDARESFLDLSRENDCEFSSLRRAKYSTAVLLYRLHQESIDTITCNVCKCMLETGFYCTICKDFDLCCDCYNLKGHNHKMEKLTVDPELKSFSGYEEINAMFTKHQPIFKIPDHVSSCMNANCSVGCCKKFRTLEEHSKNHGFDTQNCYSCYLHFYLTKNHSRICQNNNCQLFLCKKFRSTRWKLLSSIQTMEMNQNASIIPDRFQKCADAISSACDVFQNVAHPDNVELSSNYGKDIHNQGYDICQQSSTNLSTDNRIEDSALISPGQRQMKGNNSVTYDLNYQVSNISAPVKTLYEYPKTFQSHHSATDKNCAEPLASKIEAVNCQVQSTVSNVSNNTSCIVRSYVSLDPNQDSSLEIPFIKQTPVPADMVKMSHCLSSVKPLFHSDNAYLSQNSNTSNFNVSLLSVRNTGTCLTQPSSKTHQRRVHHKNNKNLKKSSLKFSNEIQTPAQGPGDILKPASQNVTTVVDSEPKIKNLMHSGGFSLELKNFNSQPNNNIQRLSPIGTKSFKIQMPVENQINASLLNNNLTVCSLQNYPPDNQFTKSNLVNQVNSPSQVPPNNNSYLSGNTNITYSETKRNPYNVPENFQQLISIASQFPRDNAVENPKMQVRLKPVQSSTSAPLQSNTNGSVFSPQMSYSQNEGIECRLNNSPLMVPMIFQNQEQPMDISTCNATTESIPSGYGTINYPATKTRIQNQREGFYFANQNISNQNHHSVQFPVYSNSIPSSENSAASFQNQTDNYPYLCNSQNMGTSENYGLNAAEINSNIAIYPEQRNAHDTFKNLQNYLQPISTYIPHDGGKTVPLCSSSNNVSPIPSNFDFNAEHSKTPKLGQNTVSGVLMYSESEAFDKILHISPEESQTFCAAPNANLLSCLNCNNFTNEDCKVYSDASMPHSCEVPSDFRPNVIPYNGSVQINILNTRKLLNNEADSNHQSYNSPEPLSFKQLYKAHRAPTSSKQKQHILSVLNNNPQQMDSVIRQRTLDQIQLQKQMFRNRGRRNSGFEKNHSKHQISAIQQNNLNPTPASQASTQLPGFHYWKPLKCTSDYRNLNSSHP